MTHLPALVPEPFRPALAVLLTAFDYAQDSEVDRWQFAVELSDLLSRGATLGDIRWLITRRLAEHAKEVTVPGDSQRSFRALAPTSFPPDTCLVLSSEGAATLRRAFGLRPSAKSPPRNRGQAALVGKPPDAVLHATPQWDATRRELCYNRQVIKRYRVPARNQALVLAAFQEMNWPQCIDDPLPPQADQDQKHRLQATVKSLNRNQLKPLIRFHGNGNGLQIYWEAVGPR